MVFLLLVASSADRHLDKTFGLLVVESSSLVSVLFREVYLAIPTSPFSFTSKWFLYYNSNNNSNNNFHHHHHHQLLQTGFLRVYWSDHYITYTTRDHSSWGMCFLSLILAVLCGLKFWLQSWWCAGWRHLIPRPPLPPTNIRKVQGHQRYGNY